VLQPRETQFNIIIDTHTAETYTTISRATQNKNFEFQLEFNHRCGFNAVRASSSFAEIKNYLILKNIDLFITNC